MGFFTSNCGELGGSVVLLVSGGISLAGFILVLGEQYQGTLAPFFEAPSQMQPPHRSLVREADARDMAESMGSGTRLPDFKAQFCHLLSYANLGKVLKLSVSQISYLQNAVED